MTNLLSIYISSIFRQLKSTQLCISYNLYFPKFTVSNSVLNTIKNIKNNTPIIEEIKEKIIEVTNKNISHVLDDDVMEDSFNNMLESDTTLDDYM